MRERRMGCMQQVVRSIPRWLRWLQWTYIGTWEIYNTHQGHQELHQCRCTPLQLSEQNSQQAASGILCCQRTVKRVGQLEDSTILSQWQICNFWTCTLPQVWTLQNWVQYIILASSPGPFELTGSDISNGPELGLGTRLYIIFADTNKYIGDTEKIHNYMLFVLWLSKVFLTQLVGEF